MSEELPVSIRGVLEHQAEVIGDETFLLFEDRVISYSEINSLTNRAANGLRALGVNDGVGVAIMMPNSPEWFTAYCATQKLGAYAVPINTGLKGEGLRYILDHSDSSILIVHPDYAESIRA
ncbi:MAG: AMP-binding protein, partial [Deltaproteobacteria bacterium]|nr:AMP-binding protein [Deltaproteobacteria bacterium]